MPPIAEAAGYMIQEKRLVMRFNRGHTEALPDIYALYKDDLVKSGRRSFT